MTMRRLPLALAIIVALVAGTAGAPRSAIQAQSPDEPTLVVTLYGGTVQYRTLPFSIVQAELSDDSGRHAEGVGFADANGVATVGFFINDEVVRPGDTLVLTNPGAAPVSMKVPALAAKADPDSDRVEGSAPPGADLYVAVQLAGEPPTVVTRTLTAAADGSFAVDLAGEADLKPGEFVGGVALTTPSGDLVQAQFTSLAAQVTLGARLLRGQASPGVQVAVERKVAGGDLEPFGVAAVEDGTTWVVDGGPTTAPLSPGDTVVVRQTGGLLDDADAVTATLEAVTVQIDAGADEVSGVAPAGAELRLEGDDMDGDGQRWTVDNPSGNYTLSVAGDADLRPGCRIRTSYEAAPGARVGAVGVLRATRIGVRLPFTVGRAQPGLPVTATLLSDTGATKAMSRSQVSDEGEYQVFFGGFFGPGRTVPEPGDTLELEFVGGDPLLFEIPLFTARANVTANAVEGEAPAEGTVRVVVDGNPAAPPVATTADVTGRYRAVFSGWTLARPANGFALYSRSESHDFFTTWAAIQLNVYPGNNLQSNTIVANGPLLQTAHADLLAPDGTIVASADSPIFGGTIFAPGIATEGPQFVMTVTDVTGQPVDMEPGDTLRVTAGDETVDLVIPPLDAVILTQANTITGRTAPNAPVTIMVSQLPPNFDAIVETTADASGNFGYDFTGELTLRHGDQFQLIAGVGGHNVLSVMIAPGLILDLDQALLLGSIAPNVAVDVTVTRSGQPLAQGRTFADVSGLFAMLLVDSTGAPVVLAEGDVIEAVPDDGTVTPLALTVPMLAVDYDIDSDRVSGVATPGGGLTMLATEAYPRGNSLGLAQAWPPIATDRTYEAQFVPSIDVHPGTRIIALYRPAEGHYAFRSVTVPILNAEHSGPSACGFGVPHQPVAVDLRDATGIDLAGAEATGRFDGYFSVLLKDVAEELVASAAGNTVRGDLVDTVATIDLPTLDVQMDWQRSFLTGTGPADKEFLLGPAVPCPQQQPAGVLSIGVNFGFTQRTGPDGAINAFVPPFLLGQGGGLEIAFFDENGHRWFRNLYRATAQIFIRTPVVAGQVNALDDVHLSLAAADATEKGAADVAANGFGQFAAALVGAAEDVSSEAGDVLTLDAGGQRTTVTVEQLAFDWSPGLGEVTGQAPASRPVVMLLRLENNQFLSITLTADEFGTFRFTPADVPPRATWTMDDVVGVRVVLPMAGGHQVIDQTPSFVTGPEPEPAKPTIYLPTAMNQGRNVAAAAVRAPPRQRAVAGAGSAAGPDAASGPGDLTAWAMAADVATLSPGAAVEESLTDVLGSFFPARGPPDRFRPVAGTAVDSIGAVPAAWPGGLAATAKAPTFPGADLAAPEASGPTAAMRAGAR